MQTISSIPPPYSLKSIPPFKHSSAPPDHCCLTGRPICSDSERVFIPTGEGRTHAVVEFASLCDALGFDTDEERCDFLHGFFGSDRSRSRVLLWKKLSRHRPDLYNLVLSALSKP